MPVVRIDYDKETFDTEFVRALANELHGVVASASGLPLSDVSIFANQNEITVNAAPMEIYVHAGATAIPNGDKDMMLKTISTAVQKFKEDKKIVIPVTISIVEMNWKCAVGI